MTDCVMGVDIGTQGVKAALYQADGQCLGSVFVSSKLHRPNAVTVEEDPEFQLDSACQAIRRCLRKAKVDGARVAALGLDGQMAGVIGVGRDGRNVTPYDSWLDQRCAPQIHQMEVAAGEEILCKTGCAPSFNHGPKILRWQQQFKSVYKTIRAFVQPAGYVVMRLCGLDGTQAFIDTTYLHFSGFADNPAGRWDEGLCARFDIDPVKLPRIVHPQEIVGQLTPAMARCCGLRPGTPVVAGCGDTAASFLACGATRAGLCVDVAGTAAVFASTTQTFQPDLKQRMLACGRAATEGLWHPYAYVAGGGMNLEWFRREVAGRGQAKGGPLSFDQLDALAEALPWTEDAPLFIPHLGGRVCPSQTALRGAWVNLNWSHSLAHLYRAVLEGVALEYGLYQQVLRDLYPEQELKEVRITGGGEKSALWNTIKADVLGVPVVRLEGGGGAPMGAALLAGLGAGLWRNLPRTAEAWIRKGERQKPNKKLAAAYQRRLARYRNLLTQLQLLEND